LELDHEVTFNTFIQPICLLDPSLKIANITNGIVVGYGYDENNSYGTLPKLMTSPIIDHNECIKNNSDFEGLLSHRTFCGGYGNGTGVCTGDSGSGLFVNDNNTFYLRGIVSSSFVDTNTICNVQTHSVFTDTLKFYWWIINTMGKMQSLTDEEREYYEGQISIAVASN
jgi:secreted trypsin-like serine protease